MFTAACLTAGCTELTQDNFKKNKLKPENFFDFNTTSSVKVDLDYGEYGANTLVNIYHGALKFNESGGIDNEPLFNIFTDDSGKAVSSFDLPGYISDSIFLCTSAIGTPQIVMAELADSTISYQYESLQYSHDDIRTRVIDWPYFGYDNGCLHSILNWYGDQYHGKIADHNGLIPSSCMFDAKRLPSVSQAYWKGQEERPGYSFDNSDWTTYNDINVITVEDNVKLYFTFLTENTKGMNAIGYYCYPKGKRPDNIGEMPKYVIFPNTSVAGNAPYTNMSETIDNEASGEYYIGKAPVSKMTTVQLLYVKYSENGGYTFSEYFPKDMEIGFFMIKDSWTPAWYNAFHTDDYRFVYTDCSMNKNMNRSFIRMDGTDFASFGVEYGNDRTYDDIMFTLQSSPKTGIQYFRTAIPDDPAAIEHVAINETHRTYCFEDLWPVRGDYDMNDVVIDHRSRVLLDKYNFVIRVIDDFTVCNRYMSAQVEDAFAVSISQRGMIDYPSGTYDEQDTDAIILFDDVQNHLGETKTIIRDFQPMTMGYDQLITDLDPFIIPLIDNDDYRNDNRREVHMPKKQGTKKLDASLLGMAQEAFFVDKDGKHPFAITIPLSVKDGEFILTEEMRQIDSEYTRFGYWVESSGRTDRDWYTKYR